MPPQHPTCHSEIPAASSSASSSATLISPSSMTSELNGAMSNMTINIHEMRNNSSWQKDWLFLDDLKDVLEFLRMQEASYERRRIRKQQELHRRSQSTNEFKVSNLPPFYDSWRPIMISWMYHVADTFRLMPIVVATGVYILDTCAGDISNPASRTYNQKELYPLMTMTALNMAVKCHETKMFPLDQLVQLLGRGGGASMKRSYTPEDVISMERRLLHRCGWKLHCPTTHDYLLRFVTVLRPEHQAGVINSAVNHLKRSLLWEHVLHQKPKQGRWSTCTASYAAFLLAMEDAQLPLSDKQAACLCLLEVANISARTPGLPEAYNWLSEAKKLQAQLEHAKNASASQAPQPSAPVDAPAQHVAPEETPQPVQSSDESCSMSCDTRQQDPVASSPDVAIIEPDSDDDEEASCTDDRSTSVMSFASSITSDHSVIFCSYSSDGDAVEVVAGDNFSEHDDDDEEDDSDDESMGHSTTVAILPTVLEEEEEAPTSSHPAITIEDDEHDTSNLVLSESIDEDGFEVAFEDKHSDCLMGLVSSPREVSVVP